MTEPVFDNLTMAWKVAEQHYRNAYPHATDIDRADVLRFLTTVATCYEADRRRAREAEAACGDPEASSEDACRCGHTRTHHYLRFGERAGCRECACSEFRSPQQPGISNHVEAWDRDAAVKKIEGQAAQITALVEILAERGETILRLQQQVASSARREGE